VRSVTSGTNGCFWRGALAAAFLAFAAGPGWAQAAAQSGDAGVFTVANVPVDATAASADAARDAARLAGERLAYNMLLAKLTLVADAARLPPATDAILNDVIQGFEVANERHSTVRYLANYTYHFRPDAVRALLRQAGVPFAETMSKPLVVLPVLDAAGGPVLWDDPNPWRDAWNQRKVPAGLVPLIVPLGGVDEVATIDANGAIKGDSAALAKVSQRYGGSDVLVSHATIIKTGDHESLNVTSTRYVPGSNGNPQTSIHSYVLGPGEDGPALMSRAVTDTVSQLEKQWKSANILDLNQAGTLTAVVPITGLPDWVAVADRLAAVAAVQKTDLLAIDRRQARVTIRYVGDLAQLRLALAQRNLDLSGDNGSFVLAYRSIAGSH
jgi:Uncharacterized protein conserved in bacteria (DUF2066)